MQKEQADPNTTASTTEDRHVPGGYHGNYLSVNLGPNDQTPVRARQVSLDPSVLRSFLGGSGLGTWLLLEHGSATCDPLSPAAAIAFVFSPLVGSPLTTSAKFAVVSKSPLTGRRLPGSPATPRCRGRRPLSADGKRSSDGPPAAIPVARNRRRRGMRGEGRRSGSRR